VAQRHAVGHHGQQQRRHHGEQRDRQREPGGAPHGRQVVRFGDQGREVFEANEHDAGAERVLLQHRHEQRLPRRPEEEHGRDGKLRRQQYVGQRLVVEVDLAVHEPCR
jgi:hypothetical protein